MSWLRAVRGLRTRPAAQAPVSATAETRGDQVSIVSGIRPGQQVVTAGQIKLRNGSAVVVDTRVQPSDAAVPTVADE